MRIVLIGVIALVIGAAGLTTPAEGVLRLRAGDVDAGTGITVTDNGTGDANGTLGVLTTSGAIGQFAVNVNTGISKPIAGGGNPESELDLTTVTINSTGPGTIVIWLEDTGYMFGDDGAKRFFGEIRGELTAPPDSTVGAMTWFHPANQVPDLGPDAFPEAALVPVGVVPAGSIAAFNPLFTTGPGAIASSSLVDVMKSGPYSLFSVVAVNFSGEGSVDLTLEAGILSAATPEPVTAALGFMGLSGLAMVMRRRAAR